MYIHLTNDEKDQLGIPHENEVYIVKGESCDFCGVWENYAFSVSPNEDIEQIYENFYDEMEEPLLEFYDKDDMEDLCDQPSFNFSVEDASNWKFEWLPNSCTKMNF